MKKSLLALAVLTAVTGAAYAQSSVTLYGKVDLGLVLDSGNSAGKSVRIASGVTGGSRIGFKGVETALAALSANNPEFAGEAADLLYHLIVLLRAKKLSLTDAIAVLEKRHAPKK